MANRATATRGADTKRPAWPAWLAAMLFGLFAFARADAYELYSWKWSDDDLPIPYYISLDNLPARVSQADYIAAVHAAFDTWASVSGSYVTFWHEDTGQAYVPKVPDEHNTIGFAELASGYIVGLASMWTRNFDTRIIEMDVELNTRHRWDTDGSCDALDVQAILTHEIGHGLGLDHSDDSTATMYYLAAYGSLSWRTLAPDDVAGVTAIYPAPEPAAGDANRDGLVNDDDLSILLANWTGSGGSGGTWGTGDFDADGAICDTDLSELLGNWTGTSGAVPEPATCWPLAIGALVVLNSPRRRRSGRRSRRLTGFLQP